MSDDGRHGLTIIAFIGSVFSPYYARANRRGFGNPAEHVAINVALYGEGKRWTMTERGARALHRDATTFAVGPSSFTWSRDALTIDFDEIAVPFPSRVKGQVRFYPATLNHQHFAISNMADHIWHPIAPLCRVEAELTRPQIRWSGRGYFDCNWGDVPLEDTFVRWDWSRSMEVDRTTIFYDVEARTGPMKPIALSIDPSGTITHMTPPPPAPLPRTLWRLARRTPCDPTTDPYVIETLEDSPFYARALISSRVNGNQTEFVHESVDLDRFRSPIVQLMLPFRMPRRA